MVHMILKRNREIRVIEIRATYKKEAVWGSEFGVWGCKVEAFRVSSMNPKP